MIVNNNVFRHKLFHELNDNYLISRLDFIYCNFKVRTVFLYKLLCLGNNYDILLKNLFKCTLDMYKICFIIIKSLNLNILEQQNKLLVLVKLKTLFTILKYIFIHNSELPFL